MKDMQTEPLLCWSGMTGTEHSITSGSNEVVLVAIRKCRFFKLKFESGFENPHSPAMIISHVY